MGRVARYKKVKACYKPDSFGQWGFGDDGRKSKKRSRTAERLKKKRKDNSFDAVVEDEDDFDLADMQVKRQSTPDPFGVKNTDESADNSFAMSKEEDKLVKAIERQIVKPKKQQYVPGRMEGESKRAFNRRVQRETRQIIKNASTEANNPEKKQKKKEFLKRKKKGKNSKWLADETVEVASDKLTVEDELIAREEETRVRFGEQAERPPTFDVLPRGAKRKPSMLSDLELEKARKKVQEQYADIRAKRRRQG